MTGKSWLMGIALGLAGCKASNSLQLPSNLASVTINHPAGDNFSSFSLSLTSTEAGTTTAAFSVTQQPLTNTTAGTNAVVEPGEYRFYLAYYTSDSTEPEYQTTTCTDPQDLATHVAELEAGEQDHTIHACNDAGDTTGNEVSVVINPVLQHVGLTSYTDQCAQCHGDNGRTQGAGDLTGSDCNGSACNDTSSLQTYVLSHISDSRLSSVSCDQACVGNVSAFIIDILRGGQ